MTATADATLPRHPIGVVSERTRLSQDVLRVWERRYGVVEPGRSASGQRLYSDADIERLRLLNMASQMGRSIGLIAALPTPELARMVREDEKERGVARDIDARSEPTSDLIAPALERTLALDGPGLQLMLYRALLSLGLPAFLDTVVVPLLTLIGTEWHAGRLAPSQEHLASAIVQRVVVSAMHTAPPAPDSPNLVVATPAGERHEIGAVLAAATAATEGWHVTYLGADLPAADIADAATRTTAAAVGLSVIYFADRARVIDEIRLLRTRLPSSIPLLIGGGASSSIATDVRRDGVRMLASLADLRRELRALGSSG